MEMEMTTMDEMRARYGQYLQGQDDAAVAASWERMQAKMAVYLERRRDSELFKDELYKWRLLQQWHGQAVHDRETLNALAYGQGEQPAIHAQLW